MATAPTLLSIEEYLHTSYHPDADFVDGEIEERNLGEYEHAKLQHIISVIFGLNEDMWEADTVIEQRIRINSSRVRIADVAVLRADAPHEEVTATPPLICIEVMSPEDRLSRAKLVLADYFAMGVPNIWLIDPIRRIAYIYNASGMQLVDSTVLAVPGTEIRLDLDDIFAKLDKKIAAHKRL
ncbi:MAG: Uma2 family endonuclease [Acidobacteriota bacterium]|nr:Uma2 family endonuclease [Acidobacteriota bacterium]